MAENFFDEDNSFGVDTQIDPKEVDAFMNDTSFNTDPKTIKPATPEDKQQAAETGKATPEKDKVAESRKKAEEQKVKDEQEARTDLEGKEETKSKETTTESTEETTELEGVAEMANDLFKAGIFTKDEGETEDDLPSTTEELVERFNWEKKKVAETMVYNLLGKHGEDYREALEAILVDGVNPRDYLAKFEEVQNYKEMDMTDEDNQARVVEAALKGQGWEDTDIRDEVKRLKLNSDLETTANRHHKALVKTEEQRMVRMQEEGRVKTEQKKQYEAQKVQNIRAILSEGLKKQELDGIPITKELVGKTVDFMENKKWKLPSGELITDYQYALLELDRPQNHETMLKLGLMLAKGFEPGKPIKLDLSSVEKKAVSRESNELFQSFRSKSKKEQPKIKEGKASDVNEFLNAL